MFVVVIGVLSILLAFTSPVARWVTAPWAVTLVLLGVTLGPALIGRWANRRVLRLLERHPEDPGHGQFIFGRWMQMLQWGLGVGHGALLLTTDWLRWCYTAPVIGDLLVVPSLVAVTPFLLATILLWLAVYPADRAVRQIALEVYLFRGRPVRPVWAAGDYVLYNLRHQVLFVLVPMLLILLARDLVTWQDEALRQVSGYRYFPDVLLGVAAIGIALVTPEILRHVWVTQRLPAGPLRDRLRALGRRLGVRCREILVWRAGGTLVNAAVMGLVPQLRYVLITDAMIEQMDDQKIEAVYGHEAGHVRRHHLLYLLLFALISGCLVTLFSVQVQRGLTSTQYSWAVALGAGVLVAKWGVLFGWISRRFERQADVYGARALVLTGLPCFQSCALHGPSGADAPLTPATVQAPPPPPPQDVLDARTPLCRSAAAVYAAALQEVAILNGMPPESGSWRHGSIAERAATVQRYAADPAALRRFERSATRMMRVILAVAVVASAAVVIELRLWELVLPNA
jgi:STE24 endopeptidase